MAGNYPDPNTQAADETNSDINAQIAPYTAQVGQLGDQEKSALDTLSKMWPGLQGAAEHSAQRLEAFYGGSMNFERGIFNAANDRLNQFRQQRAAEAQTAAQEMGAPVPMSEFTYSADAAKDQSKNQFAAQLLHSLGYATAGVGEVEAWAGKVFPLIQKEETDRTIHYFQDQINAAQKQIAQIKAGAPAAQRARADQLRLQQLQYNLDKLKADRDFKLSQQQIADERSRIKQDSENLRLQKAQALGYYEEWYRGADGKPHMRRVPTLAASTVQSENAARTSSTDIAKSQLALDTRKERLAEKELGVKNQQYAGALLDQATHPGTSSTKTITRTTKVYIWRNGDPGPPPTKFDGKDSDGYFNLKDIKSQATSTSAQPIHDPNKAYDYLLGHGVDRASAISAIRRQFGLPPSWNPNHQYKFTTQDLSRMDFSQLRNIALSLGWQTDPKHPRDSHYLTAWILKQQGLKRR